MRGPGDPCGTDASSSVPWPSLLALVVTVAVAPWPSGPSHPPRAETVADGQRATGCAGRAGGRPRRQRPAAVGRARLRAHRRHRRTPSGRPGEGTWTLGLGRPRSAQHAPRVRGPARTSVAPTRAPSGRSRSRDSAPGGSRVLDGVRTTLVAGHRPDRAVPRAPGAAGRLRPGRVGGPPRARPDRRQRRAVPPGRRHHDRRPRPAGPFGRAAGAGRPGRAGPPRRHLPRRSSTPMPTSPRAQGSFGDVVGVHRGRPGLRPVAGDRPRLARRRPCRRPQPAAAPHRRRRRLAPAGAVAGAGAAPPGGHHLGRRGRASPARTRARAPRPARCGATPPGSRPASPSRAPACCRARRRGPGTFVVSYRTRGTAPGDDRPLRHRCWSR